MKGIENSTVDSRLYARANSMLHTISLVLGTAYLLFMGLWGGLRLDHLVQSWSCGNRWFELFGVAGLFGLGYEVITFPLKFWSDYVVEHRFGLSTQSLAGFLWKHFKMNALVLVFGSSLMAALYAILWTVPNWWWLCASAGMMVASVAFGTLLPMLFVPLFYKVTPLTDQDLIARLQKITLGTGLQLSNISSFNMSKESRKANAFFTGLGASKHVMLADTLLANFAPRQVQVIFAHELGHYVHRHMVKFLICNAIMTLLSFLLCNAVLTAIAVPLSHADFTAPSALPLFILVLTAVLVASKPLTNALMRYFERQADWYSLMRTGDAEAYKSSLMLLTAMNKGELRQPPRWELLLFYTHPPIVERMAMADRWTLQQKKLTCCRQESQACQNTE